MGKRIDEDSSLRRAGRTGASFFFESRSWYTRTFGNPAKTLLENTTQISGMEKYKVYADEAMHLAEQSPTEDDRKFWLNIARAWLALMEMLGAEDSRGPGRFGMSLGGRAQTER